MPQHSRSALQSHKPEGLKPLKKAVPLKMSVSFDKVTLSILANQLALNCNESLKHTGYYKQELKGAINKVVPLLIKAESEEFDKIFDKEEDAANAVYTAVEALMIEISKTSIPEYTAIVSLIKAYRKDPKSLKGLVNKILK